MSGVTSIEPEMIAYDRQANVGIKDDVASIDKYFLDGTITEVMVNNPQADFIVEIYKKLETEAVVTIRGHIANPFFRKIWRKFQKVEVEFGLTLVEEKEEPDEFIKSHTFRKNLGEVLSIDTMRTLVLKK